MLLAHRAPKAPKIAIKLGSRSVDKTAVTRIGKYGIGINIKMAETKVNKKTDR